MVILTFFVCGFLKRFFFFFCIRLYQIGTNCKQICMINNLVSYQGHFFLEDTISIFYNLSTKQGFISFIFISFVEKNRPSVLQKKKKFSFYNQNLATLINFHRGRKFVASLWNWVIQSNEFFFFFFGFLFVFCFGLVSWILYFFSSNRFH